MRLTREQCWARLRASEHGTLSTLDAEGTIDAVPVCFAVVGTIVATPVDLVKPKTTTALGRVANLARHPAATLLADHWDRDDWSQLWWVRAHLVRRQPDDVSPKLLDECERALRAKYPPYRDPQAALFAEVIVLDVVSLTGWAAS